MPDSVRQFLDSMPSGVGGAFVAVVLSILRIVGDQKANKWGRIALEAPIAAMLTYSIWAGLAEVFGYGNGVAVAIGGIVGHFGTNAVREMARAAITNRIQK